MGGVLLDEAWEAAASALPPPGSLTSSSSEPATSSTRVSCLRSLGSRFSGSSTRQFSRSVARRCMSCLRPPASLVEPLLAESSAWTGEGSAGKFGGRVEVPRHSPESQGHAAR
jgi:hypothetical protein